MSNKFDTILGEYRQNDAGNSGWVKDGTVVRLETATDDVGIGTTTPVEKLEVDGNVFVDPQSTDVVVNNAIENTPDTTSSYFYLGNPLGTSITKVAQAFTWVTNFYDIISEIRIFTDATLGTPSGSVTVRIETDSGGSPSGTLVDANATATVDLTAPGSVIATFPADITVVDATTYHIVLVCSAQSAGNAFAINTKSGGYSSGSIKYWNGSAWIAGTAGDDLCLIITYNTDTYNPKTIFGIVGYPVASVGYNVDASAVEIRNLATGTVPVRVVTPINPIAVDEKVEFNCPIETPGIKMTTNPGANKVLESDADGNASWGSPKLPLSGGTMSGDIDFATYKAIAMACDNGTTVPTSPTPVNGQWFRQITTGRDILFQYSSATSKWIPIFSFGAITFYVDGTNGTDGMAYGTGTTTNAFRTVQYAIDLIPPINAGSVVINIAAGTYNEDITIQGKSYTGLYNISFFGPTLNTLTPDVQGTASSYTPGTKEVSPGPTPAVLTHTGQFTGLTLKGKFIQFGGTGAYYVIISNTNDTITIAENTITSATGPAYKVFTPAVTMQGVSSAAGVLQMGRVQTNVNIAAMKFLPKASGLVMTLQPYSQSAFTNCDITAGTTGNCIAQNASTFSLTHCYLHQESTTANLRCISVQPLSYFQFVGGYIYTKSSEAIRIATGGFAFNNTSNFTYIQGNGATTSAGLVVITGGSFSLTNTGFDNAVNGIVAVGGQSNYFQNSGEYTWKFTNITGSDILKSLTIRNNTFVTESTTGVVKNTVGHDSAGAYNYETLVDPKRFGDKTTNYTQFDATGHQTMAGTAKPWEDLRIEPVARTTGANAPSFEKYYDDAAGTSRGVYLYSFDDANAGSEKEVHFTMQMPHAWDSGSIKMHVHFVGAVSDTTSAPRWGLEYAWKEPGATFGDTTIVYSDGVNYTLTGTDANITAGTHYISAFAALTPGTTADGLSSILIGRLFRDSANAADTYNAAGAKCGLLYIDAHYQISGVGSTDEFTK
jgi:hypothetical protein